MAGSPRVRALQEQMEEQVEEIGGWWEGSSDHRLHQLLQLHRQQVPSAAPDFVLVRDFVELLPPWRKE